MTTADGRLTIEQRAARAAKRRNRQIEKRWPLFAEQFATTDQAERKRLEAWDALSTAYLEQLRAGALEAYRRGCERREVARRAVSAELFAERDATYQRIYGDRPLERQGYELADWWWRILRDSAPEWAQAHCPRGADHAEWWRLGGHCPVCGAKEADGGNRD